MFHMMECGCEPETHKGPGCPIWRGGPPRYMVTAIFMTTQIERGILFCRAAGDRWIPIKDADGYRYLNRALADYRVEYESVRPNNR